MNSQAWVDPRTQSVRVAGVKSYLLRRGWELQPSPGPELLVFGGPVDDDGEPIVQVLPSSEQMRDFRMRVEELIAALSVLEDRPAGEVLTDILREAPLDPPLPGSPVTGAPSPVPRP
jgi:hypothetical protein